PRVVERARPSWMSRSRRGLSSRRRADLGPPEQGAAEDLPVAEVLSRLLAQAGADDQHAPRRCASQPASGGPRGPCGRERPPAGPGAPADAAAAAEPDGFEGAPSAADVERMRARVEERAAQLQRDLGELAERRRALLRAGTESWLRREAEESLALHEARLREEAGAAAQEVRAAAAAARADLEAVVSEIDGHLAVLGAAASALRKLAEGWGPRSQSPPPPAPPTPPPPPPAPPLLLILLLPWSCGWIPAARGPSTPRHPRPWLFHGGDPQRSRSLPRVGLVAVPGPGQGPPGGRRRPDTPRRAFRGDSSGSGPSLLSPCGPGAPEGPPNPR
ncbi:unnamed protein product, partial [Prorocentrum cordatum]